MEKQLFRLLIVVGGRSMITFHKQERVKKRESYLLVTEKSVYSRREIKQALTMMAQTRLNGLIHLLSTLLCGEMGK